MNGKKPAAAAAAIGAVTAVGALLLGSTSAVAQESRPDSAYALATSGAVIITPVPYVESRDGEPVRDELIGFGDGSARNLSAGLLTVQARGGAASSSVAEVNLPGVLRADLIRTWCEDGEGGLEIVEGTLLGTGLPETPVPGTEIDLSPLARVTLNDQTRDSDGSLTVTGVELALLPGADRDRDDPLTAQEQRQVPLLGDLLGVDLGSPGSLDTVGEVVDTVTAELGVVDVGLPGSLLTVTIGSVTCSAGEDDDEDEDPADLPEAPKPEIVEADLPVTG